MTEAFDILLWPFAATMVLTGIHAYLGLHIVERGVIFVDLALAQLAALGTTIAFLAGYGLHGTAAYFFSLGFTLLGAALFALGRDSGASSRVSQEAFIGIVYAVSAAAAILIMDRLPEGAEHIKHLLVGNLLAVSPAQVMKMAALYAAVGLLHWTWREPLFAVSLQPEEARRQGVRVRLWDFLFYGSFGLVVTSSVSIAGVLLVFAYLIVPSVAAMLVARRVSARLAVGWTMGVAASVLGMLASFHWDAPTGASIVCVFGTLLAALAAAVRLRPKSH